MKEIKSKYSTAIDNLFNGIKKDYAGWGSDPEDLSDSQKDIRLKMIDEFNTGDVFKAAGWRAPAKWARGNIYDPNQNWFRWTGPDYLI